MSDAFGKLELVPPEPRATHNICGCCQGFGTIEYYDTTKDEYDGADCPKCKGTGMFKYD